MVDYRGATSSAALSPAIIVNKTQLLKLLLWMIQRCQQQTAWPWTAQMNAIQWMMAIGRALSPGLRRMHGTQHDGIAAQSSGI